MVFLSHWRTELLKYGQVWDKPTLYTNQFEFDIWGKNPELQWRERTAEWTFLRKATKLSIIWFHFKIICYWEVFGQGLEKYIRWNYKLWIFDDSFQLRILSLKCNAWYSPVRIHLYQESKMKMHNPCNQAHLKCWMLHCLMCIQQSISQFLINNSQSTYWLHTDT